MAKSLKEKTANGLFWGTVNSGATQMLNIIIGVFLARLLSPADYGVVGMLAIFIVIAGNLQSSGFPNALINLKNATHADYNAVFWFNILTSVAIYAILFAGAPLIAAFFHEPTLLPLSRFIFLTFVASAFGIVPNVILTKELKIKQLAIAGNVALIVAGATGLALAVRGHGCWSLAWQQLVYILVLNLFRYYYCAWRPTWRFSFEPIKRMFGFSVKILITMILNTLNNNILTFVFGRLFTAKVVGNFSQAYKWNTMAYSFVGNAVQQVAQPVLSSLTDDDASRERRAFRKMMRFVALLSFPCLFGLALIAHEFIITLLGAKWSDAVPLMQILCVGGAFMPFYTLYQNLAISHQRSDIYMWCNFFQIVTQMALIFLCYKQGVQFMVAAFTALNITWLIVWFMATRRLVNIRFGEFVLDIAPFMLIAAGVMALAYMVSVPINSLVLSMVVKMVTTIALYIAMMKVCRVKIFDECLNFFLKRNK